MTLYSAFSQQNLRSVLIFSNFRMTRSKEFGLEKRWLLMVDLEQREKRRQNNLQMKQNEKVTSI